MQIIFGPVYSRRFGVSLGVDLSPQMKQCNFDCLYCELAPAQPIAHQTYVVEVSTIIEELQKHLNSDIDVITLTANGEPTLYPYLDELIGQIDKIKNSIQTLILSNSATLVDKRVFNALLKLDKVKLSLDAVTPETFKKIDRPQKSINIQNIISALIAFSKVYKGELYIEILFVKGINDSDEEVQALSDTLLNVKNITRVDIGTIDRPPAYPVEGLSYDELYTIAQKFDSSLPLHVTSRKDIKNTQKLFLSKEELLNTLDKRPLTQEDIESLFDEKTKQIFQELFKEKKIGIKKAGNIEFFIPKENFTRKRVKNS